MKFENLENVQSLAIVGATGMVGKEFLDILTEHKIKIPKLKLLASKASEGEVVEVGGEEVSVEVLDEDSFDDVEVAFFSVPNEVTKKFVPIAVAAGAVVIDDSSTYRMDPNVPLVIPEINGSVLREFESGIIANPNCSTVPVAMAVKPLLDTYGIERIVVSTYQSVSGAGKEAYEELSEQAVSLLSGGNVEPKAFAHRIAFNCLPLIGSVGESGNSEEEEKVGRELRKILDESDLRVSATAVRVPTFCAHGVSVNVELRDNFKRIEDVRELMDNLPGLKVLDNPSQHIYPTNVESIGSDYTFVGRIRRDTSVDAGLNFYVITDNLRKGAALNSLQILDTLYKYRRMS